MAIAGLGPHGERAAPPERLELSDADAARARDKQFTAAVVFHTTTSDWSTQALAGIVTTLGRYSAAVVEVVDCQFRAAVQRGDNALAPLGGMSSSASPTHCRQLRLPAPRRPIVRWAGAFVFLLRAGAQQVFILGS